MRRAKKAAAATTLAVEYVCPATLIPYAGNARIHSTEQIEEIARSIEKFGFGQPILAETNYTVIAGHGRLLAAQFLKLETVPVIRLAHLSAEQARALRLADNRLAEIATWDDSILAAELLALGNLDLELISDIGWSEEDLAEKTGKATPKPKKKRAAAAGATRQLHQCPSCGHEWTAGD